MWYTYCMGDLKKKYAKEGIKASFKAKEQAKDAQIASLEDILDPVKNPDKASFSETSDWQELRKYISLYFPQAKDHDDLSANQIMAAIASALGWTIKRICEASGVGRKTVENWLGKEGVKYLISEFRLKEGEQDPSKMISGNGYRGMKMIEHILSLPLAIHNESLLKLQMDVAKFATKQYAGDAEQHINVKGSVTYKDIAEEIHKRKAEVASALSEEEEADLFIN